MKSGHYDIVRKENTSKLLWLESAEDLDRAKCRIKELTSFWPGEFQVLDQENHQLVAAIEPQLDSTDNKAEREELRDLR
jgi:hypothetical protein